MEAVDIAITTIRSSFGKSANQRLFTIMLDHFGGAFEKLLDGTGWGCMGSDGLQVGWLGWTWSGLHLCMVGFTYVLNYICFIRSLEQLLPNILT